jgi:hypothetical protein
MHHRGAAPPTLGRPRGELASADHASDEPGIGRTAVIGAAVGFLVSTIGITVAGSLGGIGFGASLGLGAFVGTWGGAGFGFMMGGTLPLARRLDSQPSPTIEPSGTTGPG